MPDIHVLDKVSALAGPDTEQSSGHIFLLKWIMERWGGEAARHVLWQLGIFYVCMLIGFGFLYLMLRSTAQLRELRKNVSEELRALHSRKYDLDDYNRGVGWNA